MLTAHHHGKGQIRVMKVFRSAEKHEVRQFLVETNLIGPVEACFLSGDNSKIVATDTQKNTVFILAKQLTPTVKSAEAFAKIIATHFVTTYPEAIKQCKVNILEEIWERTSVDGTPHHHSFQKAGPHTGFAHADVGRNEQNEVVINVLQGGVRQLTLLKTTQSSFENFVRDQYTALPETNERLLATSCDSTWQYDPETASNCPDFEILAASTRKAIVEGFSGPAATGIPSPSLQRTAFEIGQNVIDKVDGISSVTLYLPNIHNIPVNFEPFGLSNTDETGNPDVFWVTKEPFGIIQATVSRPTEGAATATNAYVMSQ